MRSDSSTDVSGMAYCSRPARTMSAWMMARVIGSMMRKVVPSPTVDMMSIDPLSACRFRLTTSRPTPRPEISLTSRAVENPGVNSSSYARAVSIGASPANPRCFAARRTTSGSMPRPSSMTSMTTELPC